MKKLINKIKSFFKRRVVSETDYLFEKCNEIAKKYNTKCTCISIMKHEAHMCISIHKGVGVCEVLNPVYEIDHSKVLATFELMCIKHHGKA